MCSLKLVSAQAERLQEEVDRLRSELSEKGGWREREAELEGEKKALLQLHEELRTSAAEQSARLTERVAEQVAAFRVKKEEYDRREAKNKRRRDEEVQKAQRSVATLKAQVDALRAEVKIASATPALPDLRKSGNGDSPQMLSTVTEQQRLIACARTDAGQLVDSLVQEVQGRLRADVAVEPEGDGGDMKVGELVDELSYELGRQDDIVRSLRVKTTPQR